MRLRKFKSYKIFQNPFIYRGSRFKSIQFQTKQNTYCSWPYHVDIDTDSNVIIVEISNRMSDGGIVYIIMNGSIKATTDTRSMRSTTSRINSYTGN